MCKKILFSFIIHSCITNRKVYAQNYFYSLHWRLETSFWMIVLKVKCNFNNPYIGIHEYWNHQVSFQTLSDCLKSKKKLQNPHLIIIRSFTYCGEQTKIFKQGVISIIHVLMFQQKHVQRTQDSILLISLLAVSIMNCSKGKFWYWRESVDGEYCISGKVKKSLFQNITLSR